MDWAPTETMAAVTELAARILKDDPTGWGALVEAGLLELDDPLDQAALLVEVGRAGARVPVLETLLLGAPVRGLAGPGEVVTGALHEPGARHPRSARAEVRAGRVFGEKVAVPAIDRATWVVVPVRDGLVGVRVSDARVELGSGSHEDPVGRLVLDGVPAVRLGGPEVLDAWLARIDLGIAALLLGLAQEGLRLTASYVSQREQFGRPIGTFQAVSQRAADAWIDTQAMEVALWSAAWRLSAGGDAARALDIARWQASEGAHRVLAAAQHLHGGMGYDKDYPLVRYTLCVAFWEHVLGGAGARLDRMGDALAS